MDWAGLLLAGLHRLALHPSQFWALTPFELQTMLGLTSAEMPMHRARLDQLQAAFPDQKKEIDDDGQ